MNIIKAIYQFLVGDPVVLVGVLMRWASVLCSPLFQSWPRSRVASGVILVFAVLIMLLSTVPLRKRTRVLSYWRPKEAPIQ